MRLKNVRKCYLFTLVLAALIVACLPICVLAEETNGDNEQTNYVTNQNEQIETDSVDEELTPMDASEPKNLNEVGTKSTDSIIAGGSCDMWDDNNDVVWQLTNEGVLIISGSGEMINYSYILTSPWYSYRNIITIVIIKKGVTNIGDYAFYGCENLSSISISSSVKSIGDYAFYGCENLSSISISSSVKSIGGRAFYNCKTLKSITISNGVETINNGAFYGCESLDSITIPGSVKTINRDAFRECKMLKTLIISNGVEKIGDYAFNKCTSLNSISIPASLKIIGPYSFSECQMLKSVTIPNSVETIESYAFYNDQRIATLKFGKGLKTIGNHAFELCKGLMEINIPGNVESIGVGAFERCYELRKIVLNEGLKSIGAQAFIWDRKWHENEIVVPSTVEAMGGQCFYYDRDSSSYAPRAYITLKCSPPSVVTSAFDLYGGIVYYPCGNEWTESEIKLWRGGQTKDDWYPYHPNTRHISQAPGNCRYGWEYDECIYCGEWLNYRVTPGYSTLYVKGLKVSKGKKSFTVKWKKQSKTNQKKFSGYQIRYSNDSSMKNAKYTTAGKASKSKKVKNLAKKTKYYVQVRTYKTIDGDRFYSKWTTVKSVTTK